MRCFAGRSVSSRGAAMPARELLLPYGGVLYDLEVTRILWTFDRGGWERIEARMRPHADRALAAVRRRDLPQAASELEAYVAGVRKELDPAADRVAIVQR